MFLPLYPFEDWFGIKALLWIPIVAFAALLLVPLIDRFRSSSLRVRWPLPAAAAVAIVVAVFLGIYAQQSTPAEHVPGEEAEAMEAE
jgi:quinol-cytochrome oxidoreductase complex cytochrome b subunit